MKSRDHQQSDVNHVCIYGDPGTGKSTLAMELLASGFKIKYFSIDAGIPRTIYNNGQPRPMTEDELDRLEIFVLRDTSSFPVGIQTCRKVIGGGEYNICDTHGQIDCSVCKRSGLGFSRVCLGEMAGDEVVIFDHLTNIGNSALNTCWDGESFVNAGKEAAQKDSDVNSTFTTWRQQGWLIGDFLTKVQIAPFNVVVIAQEMLAIFDDRSRKITPHAGTKDFSSTAASYFGEVIHCSVKNGSHRFGSSSTYQSGIITKSRSNIKIEDMAVPSLVPFLRGGQEVKMKPVNVGEIKIDGSKKPTISSSSTAKDLMLSLKGKK